MSCVDCPAGTSSVYNSSSADACGKFHFTFSSNNAETKFVLILEPKTDMVKLVTVYTFSCPKQNFRLNFNKSTVTKNTAQVN